MHNNGVKQMIKDLEEASIMDRADSVRFTVTLSERDNRRLEYLSRRYGMKRAEMSRQLLLAAIVDAEEALDIGYVIEDKNFDGKFAITDYHKYITGEISLDDLFKGQAQGGDE